MLPTLRSDLLRSARFARLSLSAPLAALAAACALAFAAPATAQPHLDGLWSPVHNWPLIAVHAALAPDGRVLTYGTDGAGKQTGYFIYDIWDPSSGPSSGHLTLNNMTLTDIFCSSQVILPQSGEILVVGGDNWTGTGTTNTGNNNSNLFDTFDNTLARSANMNRARWYSSSTVLVNGDVYIQGGNGGGDFPEVRQSNGTFRLLTTAGTGAFSATFPRNFLAPDGRVFGYDTSGRMYFVNTSGTGTVATAGQLQSANTGWTSGAAMFRPGRILQMGGNSNSAAIIDINGPTPVVTQTQSMSTQRQWVSATVLPDGKVLATGGSRVENQLTDVNNRAEIWDPATGTWHLGPAAVKARLYHSSALLLPDATVLIAGGGAPGPQTNTNAEIYYPPYLFDESGAPAPRPQIVLAPSVAEVGDTLALDVAGAVSRITLVKSGSVTHSVNMDQRFVELPFTASAGTVWAQLPARASDTPPGYYHLFAVDPDGVPSVARMLRINVDSTPSIGVDYTSTIGGAGGTAFQLSCAVDETLVGVHGRYETYINQVGPQCVQVDQFGRWIGDPVQRPVTGTLASGTAFNKLCPRDAAVSGFRGSSGQYVNQIELQCRALTPSGGLTGVGSYLGVTGAAGGTAQPLQACGTGNPGYALYGRSGSWTDSFGMLCRTAVITPISTNSTPVVVNPGAQSWIAGQAIDLAISASDGDGDALTYSASGLPGNVEIDAVSGHITGTPTVAASGQAIVTVSDGQEFDLAAFDWTVSGTAPLSVSPMAPQTSRLAGSAVAYSASATGGVNVMYKWQFGDGTLETAYDPSPSVVHTFTAPGIYFVTLTVTDDVVAVPYVQRFVQTIHLAPTPAAARSSTNIAYEPRTGSNSRVWIVNQDNDSVTAVDAVTNARLTEIPVGTAPRSVAIAPDGRIWVVNSRTGSISIVSSSSLAVVQTVTLPLASQPYGIVFSPVANQAFVVLAGSGVLLKLDGTSGAQLGLLAVGANPRHVAIDGAGATVYVSRFVTPQQLGEETGVVVPQVATGGEVVAVDAAGMTVRQTIVLRHSDKLDAENQGGGVPNYLGAVAISPDGLTAMVPSKQDNVGRGTLRSGANLNFQNTVRAISSRLDLATMAEDYARRIDHDNASVASAAAYGPLGIYLFVSLETSREVAVLDAYGNFELFRIDVGRAPQGLVVSPDGTKLFVNNFMDRTVGVYDLGELERAGDYTAPAVTTVASVVTERLTPTVLTGKQLFYDASDTRLARDSYLSCATCHNDGGQDGRVWDITGMGEGLRNTITLRGPGAAHGRAHWTSNFDEVQDFEGQIRSLSGGTGLMTDAAFNAGTRSAPLGDPKAGQSADLDALAAYVASLTEFAASPNRTSTGALTSQAVSGRSVFKRENCASCHSGTAFTNSSTNVLQNVGTIKSTSGMRLGGPLTGLDTPTLRSIWQTAPYLHDGSAPTIAAAIAAHNTVALNATDLASLAAYVSQIDAAETTAPVNAAPTIVNPGNQTGIVGKSVSLQISASDADGDVLTYSATGLPAGLAINAITGRITGTPTGVGAPNVTVWAADSRVASSTTFRFTINADTSAPTKPGRPSITLVSGKPSLTWSGSTDNVGVTGYIIYRSTSNGSQGTEVGRSTTTTFLDATATRRTWYYSVRAYDAAGNTSSRSNSRSIFVP